MSIYFTPLAVSPDGKTHAPAQEGAYVKPDYIPVSANRENVLTNEADGLCVKPRDMVSTQEPNALAVHVDNKLIVAAGKLLDMDEMIISARDNMLKTNIKLAFEKETSTLQLLGINDFPVAKVKLPEFPGLPIVAEILQDFTPPAPEGALENPHPQGTYLHLAFKMADGTLKELFMNVGDLVDIYKGSDTIDVTDNTVSVIPSTGLMSTTQGLAVDVSALLSIDEPNAIISHKGKLRVSPSRLISPSSKVLRAQAWQLDAELGIMFDRGSNSLVLTGLDGLPVSRAELPPYINNITKLEVLKDFQPEGKEKGTWLQLDFVLSNGVAGTEFYDITPLTDIYTGGDGIDITDGVVTVRLKESGGLALADGEMAVAPTALVSKQSPNSLVVHDDGLLWVNASRIAHPFDKVLSVSGNYIKTDLGVEYVSDSNEIVLRGRNDQIISRAKLPEHPGLPIDAEILHDFTPPAPENPTSPVYPTGTYMHLTFRKADGTTSDLYINVSELVDVYTGDDPIVVSPDNKISLRLSALGGLAVAGDGLYVNASKLISAEEGNSLVTGWDGLLHAQKTDPADLVSSAASNGLRVAKSDGKLYVDQVSAKTLVSADSDNALELGADKKLFAPKIMAGFGLQMVGQAIMCVKAKTGKGITVDTGGIGVNLLQIAKFDGDSGLHLGADGRMYADKGATYTGGDGIGITDTNVVFTVLDPNGGIQSSAKGLAVKTSKGLSNTPFGLAVTPADMVSTVTGNQLTVGIDGGLFVKVEAGGGGTVNPGDFGQGFEVGADGKVTVNPADFITPGSGLKVVNGKIVPDLDPASPLKLNAQGQITLDTAALGVTGGGISADAGNNLKMGSDGKPYFPSNPGTV